jgi:hypothetical protein
MRATRVFFAAWSAIFAIFFFDTFFLRSDRVDVSGPVALGAFELLGTVVCLILVLRARLGNVSLLDWFAVFASTFLACIGFAAAAVTLLAIYLFVRFPNDPNAKAAASVAAAVAVQAVWAPLIFSKISFLLLQIDAGVVGWLISLTVPGATWEGTAVYTPSGHNVSITSACASFHNLSLASLCWVTLTMLHRPQWVKSDLYIGLVAMLIQFGFNVWRLVFVCLSLPMYEYWHEGTGKHIFSAIATASAIIFVQVCLNARDKRGQQEAALGVAGVS